MPASYHHTMIRVSQPYCRTNYRTLLWQDYVRISDISNSQTQLNSKSVTLLMHETVSRQLLVLPQTAMLR